MQLARTVPQFAQDFWSDDVILDPYPHYERLRAAGPAVWLTQNSAWALTRYDSVKAALLDAATFTSVRGCTMNTPMNEASQGIMLCTDDPEHLAMRRLFARPLLPKELAALRPRLAALAEAKVEQLVAAGEFDAVADLAHYLPLAVVTELVGLDDEGRDKMLHWAAGIFDAFGPLSSPRTLSGIEIAEQAFGYVHERVDRANLVAGGWGEALFHASDRGEISELTARLMLIDYITPSLDTTINATSAAIELFAANPEQWELLRRNPALIPQAINEIVRIESPIRAFAREVTRDHRVGDAELRVGDRALMLYACANRDPLKYSEPDRFDITRRAGDQLGFGMGTHLCAGMHLAKLELTVLFEALLPRVASFHVVEAVRRPHNTLRGLARLTTRVRAATA